MEADEGVDPRIDMEQNKFMAKGEWRVRNSGIDTVRFWFGASDYKHSEFARHAHDDDHDHDDDDHGHDHHDDHDEDGVTPFSLGSRFLNRQQEGRIEVQHLPFVSALGEFSAQSASTSITGAPVALALKVNRCWSRCTRPVWLRPEFEEELAVTGGSLPAGGCTHRANNR
ncbi:hypothetical protein [Hyphomicrobium sp. D-2]|uniref:hypothetical protein n=1 Tax=Hyphomicrobium sp. D-2 TaxID=3041621 RepID=UPI00245826CD|nr:hypothetical protein [Hyphomicrobium sp. D-2]MDH4981016.1 hypothetical protein [Hyphomicrobium sp. D-2]